MLKLATAILTTLSASIFYMLQTTSEQMTSNAAALYTSLFSEEAPPWLNAPNIDLALKIAFGTLAVAGFTLLLFWLVRALTRCVRNYFLPPAPQTPPSMIPVEYAIEYIANASRYGLRNGYAMKSVGKRYMHVSTAIMAFLVAAQREKILVHGTPSSSGLRRGILPIEWYSMGIDETAAAKMQPVSTRPLFRHVSMTQYNELCITDHELNSVWPMAGGVFKLWIRLRNRFLLK